MALEVLSAKVDKEVKEKFNEVYEQLKGSNEVTTVGQFVELLIERYLNPKKVEVISPDLIDANEKLAAEKEDLTNKLLTLREGNDLLITQMDELKRESLCKDDQVNDIKTVNSELSEKYNLLQQQLSDDTVLKIHTNKVVRALMDETVTRLRERYKKPDIDLADLLQKMFLRYTIEKYTLWFFPFVLSDTDIENITGKKIKEIKQFFNNK